MATFKKRIKEPSNTDKHWIHTSQGGLNSCILIKGNSCLPNCVGYAWGRFYEITGKVPKLSRRNAEDWYSYVADGYKRGKTPKVGAVICWRKGKAGVNSDGAGHVAIVEQVNEDGSILISESGYGSFRFRTKTLKKPYSMNGYVLQGFIYNPIEFEEPLEIDGNWGVETTKKTQKVLKTVQDGIVSNQISKLKKYMPAANKTSWKFKLMGYSGGSAVIRAIQKLVGSKVDGHCGEETVKDMQTFLKIKGFYTGEITGKMTIATVKGWQKYINSRL